MTLLFSASQFCGRFCTQNFGRLRFPLNSQSYTIQEELTIIPRVTKRKKQCEKIFAQCDRRLCSYSTSNYRKTNPDDLQYTTTYYLIHHKFVYAKKSILWMTLSRIFHFPDNPSESSDT